MGVWDKKKLEEGALSHDFKIVGKASANENN